MIRYTSQHQVKIIEFSDLEQLCLNSQNRWVLLAKLLPWDELVNIYSKKFCLEHGASSISPRIVIGSMIIKHKLKLTDEETLQSISENPFMQYFLGLDYFVLEPLFSPSLFVELRKRLGKDVFDEFNTLIIQRAHPELKDRESKSSGAEQGLENKGKLKIDATVADQYIRYPNDLSLVNEAREKTEKIIDLLYELRRDTMAVKPRTYRRVVHKRYLAEAKKKQKSVKSVRKTLRVLLNCVERNLGYIDQMLDSLPLAFPLDAKYQRQLWIIRCLYDQQKWMYDQRSTRCDDRIVSISQPHVRPIVRGKQGKKVEFGSKLGLSLMDGFMTSDTLSWDAYNECADLPKQAQAYKLLFGYYPELIQADKLYATRENRAWCKERNIRLTATPLGKPLKKNAAEKRKSAKEYAERNAIEGRIGNAKQALSLNQIKAKLASTSQAWIGATIFTMNLSKFALAYDFTF